MAKVTTSHAKYKGVVVSKTDMRKLQSGLKQKMKAITDRIVEQLSYIGEECIKVAREKGDYQDITGNLRSSIGYVILVDGKPIKYGNAEQFDGKKGHGEMGEAAASELLTKLQAKFQWGIVLIVCAGMKYAAYVEAVHHKNVLTSAEIECDRLSKKLLKGLISDK